jgi:hypothetical protein
MNTPENPQHDLARYRDKRRRDGCDETWDSDSPDGKPLVCIPFWDRAEQSEADAALIVHRLNRSDELRDALGDLLAQTVDMDLKAGIGLSEGEEEARSRALSGLAKTPNPGVCSSATLPSITSGPKRLAFRVRLRQCCADIIRFRHEASSWKKVPDPFPPRLT